MEGVLRAILTHYETLGVLPTASTAELRAAYQRMLPQAHPDMGGSPALLDLVNEAYDTLKDPAKRSQYDVSIRGSAQRTEPVLPGLRPPAPALPDPSMQPEPSSPDTGPRRRRWSPALVATCVVLAILGAASLVRYVREAAARSSYTFARFQADGTTPVTYDPCRPIHYVIRPQGAPAGGTEVVRSAISRVSEATGLRFVYDGATSEAPSFPRQIEQPGRYQGRWAPVLIAWVIPGEDPTLGAGTAGAGGSASIALPNQRRAFVTGAVQLDAENMASLMKRTNGKDLARGIVLHELGHVVGLTHIDDATQLMYPRSRAGVTDFGSGDLTGLAALGKGTCQPNP